MKHDNDTSENDRKDFREMCCEARQLFSRARPEIFLNNLLCRTKKQVGYKFDNDRKGFRRMCCEAQRSMTAILPSTTGIFLNSLLYSRENDVSYKFENDRKGFRRMCCEAQRRMTAILLSTTGNIFEQFVVQPREAHSTSELREQILGQILGKN